MPETTIDPTRWIQLLGAGPSFPVRLQGGRMKQSDDFQLIRDSINRILSTPIGSMFGRREFGSRLLELVFENNDSKLHALIPVYVQEALRWEPRITVRAIKIRVSETSLNRLDILISYVVNKTQTPQNLVYPFYRELPVTDTEDMRLVR